MLTRTRTAAAQQPCLLQLQGSLSCRFFASIVGKINRVAKYKRVSVPKVPTQVYISFKILWHILYLLRWYIYRININIIYIFNVIFKLICTKSFLFIVKNSSSSVVLIVFHLRFFFYALNALRIAIQGIP